MKERNHNTSPASEKNGGIKDSQPSAKSPVLASPTSAPFTSTSASIDKNLKWTVKAQAFLSKSWRQLLLLLAVWIIGCIFIVIRPSFPPEVYAQALMNERVLTADIKYTYKDENDVDQAKEMARRQVKTIYSIQPQIVGENVNRAQKLVQKLKDVAEEGRENSNQDWIPTSDKDVNYFLKRVEDYSSEGIIDNKNQYYEEKDPDGYPISFTFAKGDGYIDPAFFKDFPTPEQATHKIIEDLCNDYGLTASQLEFFQNQMLASSIIYPTLNVDRTATNARLEDEQQKAIEKIEPKIVNIGDTLIDSRPLLGGQALKEYYRQLNATDTSSFLQKLRNVIYDLGDILRICLYLLFLIAFGFCLIKLPTKVASSTRLALLCATTFTIFLILTSITTYYAHGIEGMSFIQVLCFIPFALPSAIIANLIGFRHSIVMSFFIALTSPLFINLGHYEFQLVHFALFNTFISVMLFKNCRHRKDLLIAALGLSLCLTVSCIFFAFEQFNAGNDIAEKMLDEATKFASFSLVNGFVSTIVIYFMLMFMEWAFSLVAPSTLIELSDTHNKLLLLLQHDAPGTYQHSLNVAVVASEAADAIGANADLTRAMALFHDVGKLRNPKVFAENIPAGMSNPHNDLSPEQSVDMIRQHVTEGVAIAKRYHINRPLRSVIYQHHGNSLIGNFYQKAKKQAEDNGTPLPEETAFRYPSPRPRQKEIVIISLADACEAAIKSLFMQKLDIAAAIEECLPIIRPEIADSQNDDKELARLAAEEFKKKHPAHSTDAIRNMIDNIFETKWKDHQLDKADLTLDELRKVRESFYKTFNDMYHYRPQYASK